MSLLLNAQVTVPTNNAPAGTQYVGWSGVPAVNTKPLDIKNFYANQNINFFTNGTGVNGTSIQRMTILGNAGPTQGFVGIGGVPINKLDVFGGDIDVFSFINAYKIRDRQVLWHKGSATNIFVGVQAGQNHPFNSLAENTFVGFNAGFHCLGDVPPLIQSDRNTFIGAEAGFSTTVAFGATYVGYRAGFSHSTTPGLNTCVGYECGFLNQDGDNAFYGARAARNHVFGKNNAVFGQVAGENMNLCENSTFIGFGAGRSNGAFQSNTYLGSQAGYTSLGSENVFLGAFAGLNGVGARNVLAGYNAMQAATAGTENVIIGYNANNVSPGTSFNTIIGSQAALANNTGESNTYVGYQSALAQTTGTGNAYFGLNTGNSMIGGSGNTFLGTRADATNANSSFTNAAAIGAGAQVTFSDHMILGNNAVNVGIGLSGNAIGPGNKLEINTGAINTSGLRFRQLTSTSPAGVNPGLGVLALDNLGDVIYVAAPQGAVFGGTCGTNPLALSSSWEIPLGGFNYLFSGNNTGTVVNNVGIGLTTCLPLAKLHIDQSSGSAAGPIGLLVENNDIGPCNNPVPVVAIKGIVNTPTNTTGDQYRVGGWFEAPFANNCGVINNFAIHVPQNGGFISFGYPVPTTSGGLLNVDGNTYTSGIFITSDVTLKNTITTLPNSLNKIKNLRPVTFKWNTVKDSLMNGIHAGFIAQEVDTVIPQVVRTNASGIKSVSYEEIIPYLVSAMQAQQQQIKQMDSLITALTQSVSSCCSNSAARQTGINGNDPSALTKINVNLSDIDMIVLDQNKPNPFAEQTTITYNVPEKYGFAQLVFKTADGRIIKTVDITKNGSGQVNVFASDLSNGLYMYSLIVDGKTVDTKKMVEQN
ncbi:MAG: tail fiber domain-containing protein [Sphingobacteriaceae bacterium]|nr:tail fiber domain-containing protein [Sphingobacteriaceae bacterium]